MRAPAATAALWRVAWGLRIWVLAIEGQGRLTDSQDFKPRM